MTRYAGLTRVFIELVGIVAAAGAIVVILNRTTEPNRPLQQVEQDAGPLMAIGSSITLSERILNNAPVSIILISSPTCHYCQASEPFHKRLSDAALRSGVPFYVLVPKGDQAKQYTATVGFPTNAVKEWKDINVLPEGTPTIAAVGPDGAVKRLWLGKVPNDIETEILTIVTTPGSLSAQKTGQRNGRPNYFSMDEVSSLIRQRHAELIDIRERNQASRQGIVMPLLELPFRAPLELDKGRLNIVNCSGVPEKVCDRGVALLVSSGFKEVGTFGAAAYYRNCQLARLSDVGSSRSKAGHTL
jgi:hypothetical protein